MIPISVKHKLTVNGEEKLPAGITSPFIMWIMAVILVGLGGVTSLNLLIKGTISGKKGQERHITLVSNEIKTNPADNSTSLLVTEIEHYKKQYPDLSDSLDIHLRVCNLQQEYFDKIKSQVKMSDEEVNHKIEQGDFLLKGVDFTINQQFFAELKERLRDVIHKAGGMEIPTEAERFISLNALKPFYRKEAIEFKGRINYNSWTKGICPVCGSAPLMGKLGEDNGKLFLECSLCETTWPFPRVTCAFCDNTDQNTLGYFYPENNKAYRINVCQQCEKYIKIIDERILNKKAVLQIENIVSDYLDVAVEREGYQTVKFNNK